VELFAAIRRDARVDECSIRELADRHHVHRRTVRRALASAIPPPRKTPTRSSPRLQPFKALIDDMLRSDLDAPKKQRHTVRRVLARLVDEHGVTELSYSTVRDYVRKRRPEIAAAGGKPIEEGYVPQTHLPAAEGEVDFHDLCVVLRGIKTKTALFTMRLSFSGRAVHRASLSQGRKHSWKATSTPSTGWRRPAQADPLRQPQARGVQGAVRPHPGGVRPVGGLQVALWLRCVLLPPGP
jgi:hypothetical protein